MKLYIALVCSLAFLFQSAKTDSEDKWIATVEETAAISGSKGEYRRLIFRSVANKAKSFSVQVVLLQPGSYKAEVIDNLSNNPTDYQSVAKLTESKKATVGINGGFFTKDFKPNGLFIYKGKTLFPIKRLPSPVLAGLLLIDRNGSAKFESAKEFSSQDAGDISYALQSGPFLVENNQISKDAISSGMISNQIVKHTAMALSSDNRLMVISSSPIPLKVFANCLYKMPSVFGVPKVEIALSLDGGRSSAFAFRDSNKFAAIEEGWPVRNSILFFLK